MQPDLYNGRIIVVVVVCIHLVKCNTWSQFKCLYTVIHNFYQPF